MMNVIDLIAGLMIGVLAGMGVGGGGLLVLYLTFVKNMQQLDAQGLNLVFFTAASISSLIYHVKKRKLNLRLTVILCILGIPGAYFGFKAAAAAHPETVRKVFGWLLILSGITSLFSKRKKLMKGTEKRQREKIFDFFEKRG